MSVAQAGRQAEAPLLSPRRGWTSKALSYPRRRPIEFVAIAVLAMVVVSALGADVIAPTHYSDPDFTARLQAPSGGHLFGTDNLGRDVLSRVIYGARTSIMASTLAVLISGVLGTTIGLVSGYVGGKFDLVVQRITDSITPVPLILMAMVMIVAMGASLLNVALALGFVGAMRVNRVMRGATLSVQQNPYVEAAISIGATAPRILLKHILPNTLANLIVLSSVQFAGFVLAEASLSFLGLGIPPPTPSWGGMLSGEGRAYFLVAPWLGIVPGVAISLTVLAANIAGDGLRDALDPRLRGA